MFSHFQCFSLHHGRIERKKMAQLMITKHKGTHRSDRTWHENGEKSEILHLQYVSAIIESLVSDVDCFA